MKENVDYIAIENDDIHKLINFSPEIKKACEEYKKKYGKYPGT